MDRADSHGLQSRRRLKQTRWQGRERVAVNEAEQKDTRHGMVAWQRMGNIVLTPQEHWRLRPNHRNHCRRLSQGYIFTKRKLSEWAYHRI